jgi:LysM repeat protein
MDTARDAAAGSSFSGAFEAARRQLDDGHLVEGLQQLSVWYDDPRLSPIEQEELTHLLDQVSGTVIYSTRSLLESPYEVLPGERLDDIAQKYNVPAQLLAKINGIENTNDLRPGERLKVVRGPFNAVISLDKKQLTLLLGGSYAGHFNIGLGREYPAAEGQYVVTDKLVNPTYHGLERAIDADDPANPLGERWIGLGDRMSIHSTNNPSSIGKTDLPGCISLNPRDAEDVFDILSEGSKVLIRR